MSSANAPRPWSRGRKRPAKITKARKAVILAALEQGQTRTAAAALAGIHRSTLYDLMAREPDLAEAADLAEAKAEASVAKALYDQATGPRADFRAQVAWLERRRRVDWKPATATMEVSGPDGGPIELADIRRKVEGILDRYAAEGSPPGDPGPTDPE